MVGKMQTLVIAVILVMGIYILPSVTAKFSGSHTMELNQSIGVNGLQCMKCHTYILDELNATGPSQSVLQAHWNAAGNTNYVGANKDLNISAGINNVTVAGACRMCHLMEDDAVNIAGTHTKITIRTCIDANCHGDSPGTGSTEYIDAGSVGGKLSNSSDAHSAFFGAMKGADSSYPNEDGGNYSAGFYACLACHTHLEMNMNLTRPQAFNINMTMDEATNAFVIEGPAINYTNMNQTYAQREKGSVWS